MINKLSGLNKEENKNIGIERKKRLKRYIKETTIAQTEPIYLFLN